MLSKKIYTLSGDDHTGIWAEIFHSEAQLEQKLLELIAMELATSIEDAQKYAKEIDKNYLDTLLSLDKANSYLIDEQTIEIKTPSPDQAPIEYLATFSIPTILTISLPTTDLDETKKILQNCRANTTITLDLNYQGLPVDGTISDMKCATLTDKTVI